MGNNNIAAELNRTGSGETPNRSSTWYKNEPGSSSNNPPTWSHPRWSFAAESAPARRSASLAEIEAEVRARLPAAESLEASSAAAAADQYEWARGPIENIPVEKLSYRKLREAARKEGATDEQLEAASDDDQLQLQMKKLVET